MVWICMFLESEISIETHFKRMPHNDFGNRRNIREIDTQPELSCHRFGHDKIKSLTILKCSVRPYIEYQRHYCVYRMVCIEKNSCIQYQLIWIRRALIDINTNHLKLLWSARFAIWFCSKLKSINIHSFQIYYIFIR